MHRATFKILYLDSHSHASATSETIKVYNIAFFENIFFQSFSFTVR